MQDRFEIGDHVRGNSEAGRVNGSIRRKISADGAPQAPSPGQAQVETGRSGVGRDE